MHVLLVLLSHSVNEAHSYLRKPACTEIDPNEAAECMAQPVKFKVVIILEEKVPVIGGCNIIMA